MPTLSRPSDVDRRGAKVGPPQVQGPGGAVPDFFEVGGLAPSAPVLRVHKRAALEVDPNAPCREDEILVASWNAENLFDAVDDPAKDDARFLPASQPAYTDETVAQHIGSLSKVIRAMNGGKGPDILALTEVENLEVGERLRKEGLAELGYEPLVLVEGPDKRGIDQAVLSRYPLLEPARLHPVVHPSTGKEYRGILEATLSVQGRPLTVFVNHWYANGKGMELEKALEQRMFAAKVLRARMDELLAADPGREVVVLGDFNDPPQARTFGREGLAVAGSASEARRAETLYNTTESIEAKKAALGDEGDAVQLGTHYFHPEAAWRSFDHILVSHTLLDGEGLAWVPGSTVVVKTALNTEEGGTPRGFFLPRLGDQAPSVDPGGSSNHFPVAMRLRQAGLARRPKEE